jgi:catechol 1,2-dioxygenase
MMSISPAAQETGYFTEHDSAEVVISRNARAKNARLKQIMEVVTRKLHEAVKEIEPSQQEWMSAIEFLTSTGKTCSEWRQEWILCSDVLGVSMLVDAINNRKPSGATETTVLGPFYVPDAPRYPHGANICLDGKGKPLLVTGSVKDTEGRPIAGAIVDVWQANEDGFYDVQQKGTQPDMNLRGVFETDADGRFWFRSIMPRFYPIPDDGPVGQLLAALGRHPNRPAHIHFIIQAEGFAPVTTHLFDPNCPYLHSDAVFGVKQELIAQFELLDDPARAHSLGVSNPFSSVHWDFVLTRT